MVALFTRKFIKKISDESKIIVIKMQKKSPNGSVGALL